MSGEQYSTTNTFPTTPVPTPSQLHEIPELLPTSLYVKTGRWVKVKCQEGHDSQMDQFTLTTSAAAPQPHTKSLDLISAPSIAQTPTRCHIDKIKQLHKTAATSTIHVCWQLEGAEVSGVTVAQATGSSLPTPAPPPASYTTPPSLLPTPLSCWKLAGGLG